MKKLCVLTIIVFASATYASHSLAMDEELAGDPPLHDVSAALYAGAEWAAVNGYAASSQATTLLQRAARFLWKNTESGGAAYSGDPANPVIHRQFEALIRRESTDATIRDEHFADLFDKHAKRAYYGSYAIRASIEQAHKTTSESEKRRHLSTVEQILASNQRALPPLIEELANKFIDEQRSALGLPPLERSLQRVPSGQQRPESP